MQASPLRAEHYASCDSRKAHINETQSLWKVDDDGWLRREERFLAETSPYVEAVLEGGSGGPLEMASVPKGLLVFVQDMVNRFGVVPTEFSRIEDVVHRLLSFLDYTEPYYLLVDSPIQLSNGQLLNTYRSKRTGSVLPPDEIECFRVVSGYEFKHYRAAMEVLEHPATQAVLRGEFVKHNARGDAVTRSDVLNRISELVWGSPEFLKSWVEEWLWGFYEEVSYNSPRLEDDKLMSLNAFQQRDLPFWQVVSVSSLLWFRSPFALKYLVEYHPIYNAVLNWNEKTNSPEIVPGSGGEAIVRGWDIYTHLHLTVEQGVEPGTCACCKKPLHCTKYVNAWAITQPVCSCGDVVPIEVEKDYVYRNKHQKPECQPYLAKYPTIVDFVCQHCLFNMMNRLPPEVRCGRSSCPNTECVHHAGQSAYIRTLTKNRTMLLTSRQTQ